MTPEDHNAIAARFFEAMAYLKDTRQIRGLQTFTRRYGIPRSSVADAMREPSRHSFRAIWLTYLVRDYNISAEWLLTGEGRMHD